MARNLESLVAASLRSSQRISADELAREWLRRLILTGELPLGSRLVQADIAEVLGISTTPVRDAIRDLQAEGLVKLDPRRGTVVVELSDLELVDVFEMRRLLEPLAFEKAIPRLTVEVTERLQSLHERMQLEHLSEQWVSLNREFHRLIYETAGSQRLFNTIAELQDASVAFVSAVLHRAPEVRGRAVADHAEMIAALRAADLKRGAAAITRHLEIPRDALERLNQQERVDGSPQSAADILRMAMLEKKVATGL